MRTCVYARTCATRQPIGRKLWARVPTGHHARALIGRLPSELDPPASNCDFAADNGNNSSILVAHLARL